jgi:hypothetical protein
MRGVKAAIKNRLEEQPDGSKKSTSQPQVTSSFLNRLEQQANDSRHATSKSRQPRIAERIVPPQPPSSQSHVAESRRRPSPKRSQVPQSPPSPKTSPVAESRPSPKRSPVHDKIFLNNVSGEGNNCFFQALRGVLGEEYVRSLLNIPSGSSIRPTINKFRTFLSNLYKTNESITRNTVETSIEILLATIAGVDDKDIAISMIEDQLQVGWEIADVLYENRYNDLNTIRKEMSKAILTSTMVSELDITLINHQLDKLNSGIILKVINVDYGLMKRKNSAGQLQYMKDRIHEALDPETNASMKYALITTDSFHYNFLTHGTDQETGLWTLREVRAIDRVTAMEVDEFPKTFLNGGSRRLRSKAMQKKKVPRKTSVGKGRRREQT